ncbi:MAG: hypothetical protein ACLFQX_13635, partial [Candidatus Kapaibacterium sp.]
MPQQETTNKSEQKRSIFAKILRFLGRVALGIIALLVLISLALIVISQTDSFRQWAVGIITGAVNSALTARLEIDDITMINLRGIEVHNPRLLAAGDTLAQMDKLTISLKYAPLLRSKARIRYIELDNPVIKILRSRTDSTWNVNHIAPPSADTTDAGPSPWEIYLGELEINSGEFMLIDSTKDISPRRQINYANIHAVGWHMKAGAEAILAKNKFKLDLKNLTALERNSDFMLIGFAGNFGLDTTGISGEDVELRTAETSLELQPEIKNFNVFAGADITRANFDVRLDADKINPRDIEYFAQIPIKIGAEPRIVIDANGQLNNMNIKLLELEYSSTRINASGSLTDVLRPEDFRYDFDLSDSRIARYDISRALPGMDFSAIPDFGQANIYKLHAKGGGDTASADMNISTAIGRIEGQAGMGFARGFHYFADADFKNADLSKILNNPDLAGGMNIQADLRGSGTDPRTMFAQGEIIFGAGRAGRFDLERGRISGRARSGVITLDTMFLEFADSREIADAGADPSPTIAASGIMDFTEINPKYSIRAAVNGISPSKLLNNESLPRSFAGEFDLEGSGIVPDSMELDLNSRIDYISLGDMVMMPFDLDVRLDRPEPERRSLEINSDFFTLTAKGKYNFSTMITSFENQGVYLSEFVSKRFASIVPEIKTEKNLRDSVAITHTTGFTPVDFYIAGRIDDLSPLSSFIPDMKIYSNVDFGLSFRADSNRSSFKLDSLVVEEFNLESPGNHIYSDPVRISGGIMMSLRDSVPVFTNLRLNLEGRRNTNIGDLVIKQPRAKV